MAKLSAKQRRGLKKSDFVFPGSRSYPIPDETHARAALSMVAVHETATQKKKVKAAVRKRYPGINVDGKKPVSALARKKKRRASALA